MVLARILVAAVVVMFSVALTDGRVLRNTNNQAFCQRAQLTREECRDQGKDSPIGACYVDGFNGLYDSCAETCSVDQMETLPGSLKCEHYCADYNTKQCNQFKVDKRTVIEMLASLEADVAQVKLNQKKMHRMLARLTGKRTVPDVTTTATPERVANPSK